MKNTLLLYIAAAVLLASTAAIAQAQDNSTTQQTTTTTTTSQNDSANSTADTHSNVRTLTGCLRRGEDANEYNLVARDGSTWELRSDAVDLSSHVGQTVMLTGAVAHPNMHGMKEDAKKEAQEHGMDKSATEHGHLTVTDLDMVSSTCSQ